MSISDSQDNKNKKEKNFIKPVRSIKNRKERNSQKRFYLLTGAAVLAVVCLIGIVSAVLYSALPKNAGEKKAKGDSITVSAETSGKEASAVIATAGDIVPHMPIIGSAVYKSDSGDFDYTDIFKYYRGIPENADFAVTTLETSLAGKEAGYTGFPMFKTPDALADTLKGVGFDMINLASNHVYDGLDDGFFRTLETLEKKEILYDGARSSEDKIRYTVQDINGIKVGFTNYVYETTEGTDGKYINGNPISDKVSPLINSFNYNNLDSFYSEMEENLKGMKEDGAQYNIVYMHWGEEYHTTPSDYQTKMAQKLCDLGVDALIGSHPHVIQPVDLLTSTDGSRQMVCAYAIGNFLSNQQLEELGGIVPTGETEDGYTLTLSLSSDKKGKVTLKEAAFTPTWVYRYYDSDATYYILPVNKPEELEKLTGLSGIQEGARESKDRTDKIIGEGVQKVQNALPITN